MKGDWLWWCLWVCFCLSCSVDAATDSTDAQVMAEMAKTVKVDNTWAGNDPCSGWTGVSCSETKVTGINIQAMNLEGTLPADFNKLSALSSISMQRNLLSGPLPSFSGLSNLQSVFLGSNEFDSIPADFFHGLTSLQTFAIDDNSLLAPWSIPEDLASAVALASFSANNASIRGELPEFLGNGTMKWLLTLQLAYNYLNGSIPTSFKSSSLQVMWLNYQNGNLLGGSIATVGAMSQLTQVWLALNAFTGPVPDFKSASLFHWQLRRLTLSGNSLTGLIPSELTQLPNLQSVFLGSNAFDSIPADFFHGLTNLQTFVIDDNSQLKAWSMPAGLTSFSATTESLDISHLAQFWLALNAFTGPVAGLRRLTLSGNSLEGSIPSEPTQLPNLKKLDVTNNQLSGAIPKFASSVSVLTGGNPQIGKSPSTRSSPPWASTGSSGSNNRTSSGSNAGGGGGGGGSGSKTWIAGIIIGVEALELVGGLCYCYASRKRQRSTRVQSPTTVATNPHRRGAPASSYQDQSKVSITPSISLMVSNMSNGDTSDGHVVEPPGNMVISIEVLREATDNFSDETILGRGGFGVVYRGELHDGTKIAAKRMKAAKMNSMGLREFQAEIAVLTKVRHRHLVGFLGYCIDGGEKVVVYEYMAHGPLSLHLFEWADAGLRPLEWKQRLTVALDVARGVEYLHSLAQTSFIHRDLKTSNILLDDNMRAKVSDFGLVRRVPDGKLSVETRLAGTFGYLPPEYAGTGRVTTKVDVFSFGAVLMELITGRKALDETQPEESMHLVTWFRRVLMSREGFRNAVDPVLDMTDDTFQNICTVAELSGHCTSEKPSQRPDMGYVVNVLSPLVEQWKPADMDAQDCCGTDLGVSSPWCSWDDMPLRRSSIPHRQGIFSQKLEQYSDKHSQKASEIWRLL